MLIAVFSDSHGNVDNMAAAVEKYKPDCVFHLGDCCRDAEELQRLFPMLPMKILRGNCDFGDTEHDEDLLTEIDGVRVFAAHGHRHGVKLGLTKFCNSVYFSGSALGLYGHTHRPMWREVRGMQIVNPGSVGSGVKPTFALVEIAGGKANGRIIDITEA